MTTRTLVLIVVIALGMLAIPFIKGVIIEGKSLQVAFTPLPDAPYMAQK